jgi:hypothetical protein
MYTYRLLIFFAMVQLCYTPLQAQVSIMMHPLQNFQLKPGDMFHADVLNTGNKTYQMYFTGTIVNTQNGQKIVTGRTSAIDIVPGSTQINETLLAPEYIFASTVTEQTGSLPYGNYMVCLDAHQINGVEAEANACLDIELTPMSPPLLLNPENESSVTEDYPLLIWLPPMPVSKEKVLYDLRLVEITPNQTPYDAIQRNFAILEQKNISGTTLQYPANAMRLEVRKKYAWKVNAYTADRKPLGETEVWWFTKNAIDPGLKEVPVMDHHYIVLDEAADKKKVTIRERLKVVSEEYINHEEIVYLILDDEGKEIPKEDIKVTAEGSGKFVFTFINPKKLWDKNLHLVVTTPKGRKRFISFTISKP